MQTSTHLRLFLQAPSHQHEGTNPDKPRGGNGNSAAGLQLERIFVITLIVGGIHKLAALHRLVDEYVGCRIPPQVVVTVWQGNIAVRHEFVGQGTRIASVICCIQTLYIPRSVEAKTPYEVGFTIRCETIQQYLIAKGGNVKQGTQWFKLWSGPIVAIGDDILIAVAEIIARREAFRWNDKLQRREKE